MASFQTPILTVDDRRANLFAVEALLGQSDYEIRSAASSVDALAELEERDFAVILLDLQLPNMDGLETARRMSARARALGRHAPIIFVTPFDIDEAQVLAAYAVGAVDLMQAPLDPKVLCAKVAVFADLYRARDLAAWNATKLTREQENTAEEARRFRLLVESVKDYAIFILDPSGIITTWNAGAEHLKQYTAREAIGRHFSIFYSEAEVRDGKCDRELEVARNVGRFEEEGWRHRKDGTRFWANVTITALREGDQGTLIGFAKVTQDLTARKFAEDDANRFRLLVESVKDYAIFILTPEGRVATWNAGAQRIKQYTSAEIVGQHFSVFYPPAEVAAGKCDEELAIASTEGRFEEEGWRVRKDHSRFWANVTITALRSEQGVLVGFAKVTRDLTERVAHEETLLALAVEKAALAEKAQIQQFQERFIAILGHDLRNPLSAMDMGASLLQQRAVQAKDEAGIRILHRMKASSRRMTRMIEQILDLTRVRLASGLAIEPKTMDLAQTITTIIDELRISNPAGSVDVTGPASLVGQWDADRLEQVISNLAGNAVQYGSPGRPVRIDLVADGDDVIVTVHNDGPPIPEAVRSELFSPFRRGERDSRAPETAGLGLGLYISHEIVLAHGGTIEVASSPLQGTTFQVRLPRNSPIQRAPRSST